MGFHVLSHRRRQQVTPFLLGCMVTFVVLRYLVTTDEGPPSTKKWKTVVDKSRKADLQPHNPVGKLHMKLYVPEPQHHSANNASVKTSPTLQQSFSLVGSSFNSDGVSQRLSFHVTTSMVYTFSSTMESLARGMLTDKTKYYAISPAIVQRSSQMTVISRIRLDWWKMEYRKRPVFFSGNWLMKQAFDGNMHPTGNATLLKTAARKQKSTDHLLAVGHQSDPRIFFVQNKVFLLVSVFVLNQLHHVADGAVIAIPYVLWDSANNVQHILEIDGRPQTTIENIPHQKLTNTSYGLLKAPEKNWMPFAVGDQIFIVRTLDPLNILRCTTTGRCETVHDENSNHEVFRDEFFHLRGGTPFEHYQGQYYIGIAHCTLYVTSNNLRYYTSHVVVLNVDPYRIVYISNDIELNPKIFTTYPKAKAKSVKIDNDFIYPVGIVVEDLDTVLISGHVNDNGSILVRLKGISAIMKSVISKDMRESILQGPPAGTLQTHIYEEMQADKNIEFLHAN